MKNDVHKRNPEISFAFEKYVLIQSSPAKHVVPLQVSATMFLYNENCYVQGIVHQKIYPFVHLPIIPCCPLASKFNKHICLELFSKLFIFLC